jgi:hypothetical protein
MTHPNCSEEGIYIAFWHGKGIKVTKRDGKDETFNSAAELKSALVEHVQQQGLDKITVEVVDVSPSARAMQRLKEKVAKAQKPKAAKAQSIRKRPTKRG